MSGCFLDGADLLGNNRLERNVAYVDFYSRWSKEFGIDQIVMLDNASDLRSVFEFNKRVGGAYASFDQIDTLMKLSPSRVLFARFEERLVRGHGPHDYPYCWRALWAVQSLISAGFDRILCFDSDTYALTMDVAKYIRERTNGWYAFWSESGRHPESSASVLCRDAFPRFEEYVATPWVDKVGIMMEHDIPVTDLVPSYRCSRFGERGAPKQDETMDIYCQRPLTVDLEFGRFR